VGARIVGERANIYSPSDINKGEEVVVPQQCDDDDDDDMASLNVLSVECLHDVVKAGDPFGFRVTLSCTALLEQGRTSSATPTLP